MRKVRLLKLTPKRDGGNLSGCEMIICRIKNLTLKNGKVFEPGSVKRIESFVTRLDVKVVGPTPLTAGQSPYFAARCC